MSDIPTDIRQRAVESDGRLGPDERELRIVGATDQDHCIVSTEVPVFMRWLLSIRDSQFERARTNDSGSVVAITAKVPKGYLRLQKNNRDSQGHSRMVAYGPLRGGRKDE